LQAWTHERLSFQGKHFHFDDVEVLPKPLQRPHPPVWMAASSEAAIDWAATRGFSILMDPHSSRAELGSKRRRYTERMAAAGFSDQGRDIPMARLVALAATSAEAEEVARRGAQWLVDSYAGPQHQSQKTQQQRRTYGGKEPVQFYMEDVIIHGSPDKVVDDIARLKEEVGLNYLMCAPLSRESFRLLADQVVPRL
jgi:alkanesulfonate monooxygenase SsuD/methylene tetrahydromethanopterin reductase-like flavin-dependent oxidoreductase (luciferase family)